MMMKILLLFISFTILSCGVKTTRNYMTSGDYDSAISKAINGLKNNKDKKGNQDYVYMLEEAFAKAKERDLNAVGLLKREGNPANYEKIYNTYLLLHNRQESIKPLLPLKLLVEGRNAIFPMDDYTTALVESKNNLSNYIYNNSKALLITTNKQAIRRAFDDLNYLSQINPNYKDTNNLIQQALLKGRDYVKVNLNNETKIMIPNDLQASLLDFTTYGLNKQWTEFHNNSVKGIKYDYTVNLNFKNILISPEQVNQKQFVKEKQIQDGEQTMLDSNGIVIKDSNGNPVKTPIMKTVTISIYEFAQFKSCQVTAQVDYVDNMTKQLINSYPLTSQWNFENAYATYKGDKRAVEEAYFPYFTRGALPFPSNEQMVYNIGEDLKARLKDILVKNNFN
jgi:hypothetical protein